MTGRGSSISLSAMKTLLLAALLATAGCAAPAAVEKGHVHTDVCGHWFDGEGWRTSPGHAHQAGCGHVYRGGRWVAGD